MQDNTKTRVEARTASRVSKKRKKKKLKTLVVCLLTLLVSLVTVIYVAKSKLIPGLYLFFIILFLLALNAGVFLLMQKRKYVLGIAFAVILIVLQLVLCFYVSRGTKALREITTTTVVESEIGVYVRAEDSAHSIQEAKDYLFATAAFVEPEETAQTLSQLAEQCGSALRNTEVDGLPALADALLNGEVDAILLPVAYFPLYNDMEGYEDFSDQVRLLESRIVQISVPAEEKPVKEPERNQQEQRTSDFFTVFISGIDNRGALVARSRSDVNILAAVNTKTGKITLVSVPRDYYVPLSNSGQYDKLTHAGVYGVDVSAETVGNIFDIDVDYYFRVNFGGFVEIVDALGGITVDSDYSFSAGGYSFSAGENYLYGDQALAFCRERHAFASGDRQRGKNQIAVIKGILRKALSTDMLKNYSEFLSGVEGSFETSMPYDQIAALVQNQLTERTEWDIQSTSVTGSDANDYCYSLGMYAYVMRPDTSSVAEAAALLEETRKG